MAVITTVRGRLRDADPAAAMAHHNEIVDRLRPRGEPFGSVGHAAYARADDPREFLAIDRWQSVEGLQRFMADPSVPAELASLFESPPEVTIWIERDGWRAF
ncbi:MAG TPA: hypothetical protein VNJ28_00635 [Candidatus Limnocylindrales bacterium]|jgi:quinol monooxygenase YgiN|nr:hypothetical protein [Candidatus Limnocylindrales bacterium]